MSKAIAATQASDRLAGVLAIATALGSIVLLAAHPQDRARDFAELVQGEARNQIQNLIVHGGFAVVLSIQIVCFGFLSSRLEASARFASRAAIAFFAIGVAWMSASLLMDGLVTPAIAVRYADQTETVRPLFVLVGAIVRFAMPLGLGFQTLAIWCWGAAMLGAGLRVFAAIVWLLGVVLVVAIGAGASGAMPMALMGAFLAMAIWGIIAGVVLLRGKPAG